MQRAFYLLLIVLLTVKINVNGTIKKDLEMIYLVSAPMFYYQEFELPEQYSKFNENWTGFNGNFPEIPHATVFGNTDSTFIFSSTGISKDDPMGCAERIIRSNKFNSIKLQSIPEGETRTITGVMTFDTNGLIQVYAGKDNIPYTSDDIFVYAPRYWERISIDLTSYYVCSNINSLQIKL